MARKEVIKIAPEQKGDNLIIFNRICHELFFDN